MSDQLSADLSSLKIDRSGPPPSRGWLKLLIWVGVLGALAFGGIALKPRLEAKLFKTEVESTEVMLVSPAQASIKLTASGYVQADITSQVTPKVPGRVLKVYVKQGDQVKAGQLLLELDPTDNDASIKAAKSQAAAAWAQAQSAEARAAVAKAQLAEVNQQAQRESKLASEGAVAQATADDLEAKVNSLKQSLEAAQAEARAARAQAASLNAQVNVLKTGLANLQLLSPISGTVLNKPPQIGEYIAPQPAGISDEGDGIRIADFSSLLVEADIPESRLNLVKVGGPTEIVFDAYPSKRFRGHVKEITPEVDRAKATVNVKVAIDDAAKGVFPDMSARVSFLAKELDKEAAKEPPKIVIPSSAVATRSGAKVVFVITDDRVHMLPLKLGAPFGDGFEVLQGPKPGTEVVKNPPDTLNDGQKVKKAEG